MSSANHDTVLPPASRNVKRVHVDGDTVLPAFGTNGLLLPGAMIDERWTVVRHINTGGNGVVYEVEDNLVGRRFAIKRLRHDLAVRKELIDLFIREAELAMQFTAESPRFVTVRHVGRDREGPYLVMDYVSDPTLRQVLEKSDQRRLGLLPAVKVLREVALALVDLHALNVVHRDLKPENIFVQISKEITKVRLVDFGISKFGGSSTTTSLHGSGTFNYASPEQRKGRKTSAQTDIYAFGVIAYEILSGELPMFGERLSDYIESVPDAMETLVHKCLNGKPELRPGDGQSLVAECENLLANLASKTNKSSRESQSATQPPATAVGSGPTIEPGKRQSHRNQETKAIPATSAKTTDLNGTSIVSIVGAPEGAQIFINNMQIRGTTQSFPRSDRAKNLYVHIKCLGYEEYAITKAINGEPEVVINVNMSRVAVPASPRPEPNLFSTDKTTYSNGTTVVSIVGAPQGAQIFINNMQIRGSKQSFPRSARAKNLYVLIKCLGYEDYAITKAINGEPDVVINVNMSRVDIPATLRPETKDSSPTKTVEKPIKYWADSIVMLFDVPSASVMAINGQKITDNRIVVPVNSQYSRATLEVLCEGYHPYKIELELVASYVTQHRVALRPITRNSKGHLQDKSWLSWYLHEVRLIKSHTFQMGGTKFANEQPCHTVLLDDFWIGSTPVPAGLWHEYCVATGKSMPEAPNWSWNSHHPITNVSWNDIMGSSGANGFCQWASEVSGSLVSLPTEAQYECACRGGIDGQGYPWGDVFRENLKWPSNAQALGFINRTVDIHRNNLGLSDLVGHISHWCLDCYAPYYGGAFAEPEGKSSALCQNRCVRGSSWLSGDPMVHRSAYRQSHPAGFRTWDLGFRIVMSPSA
jgi:serine/threonine protein kinase/formylglycine-generating enzyme required for sulfatase activity